MNGLTYAELEAQFAKLYEQLPFQPRTTMAFANLDDIYRFRQMIGATGEPTPPWSAPIVSLTGIPIVIDRDMHEGVAELRTDTTVRRFALYGNTLARQREAILARFLTTAEELEDAADDKPGMEAGCLRTGYGACHRCKLSGPIFRYEIDPRHRRFLGCACTEEGEICFPCFSGVADPGSGDLIVCGGCFTDTEACTWSEWLDKRALPWLCPACWKTVAAEEISHIQVLEATNPF